jgi:drug/metabolite transporter (DMT)-like permease
MFMYVFSIVLIVASNVVYNISQKSTPQNANPFAALLVTYLTATLVVVVAFLFYRTDDGILESFKALNWTSVVLGVSIVCLEFGYMMAYRSGWNISIGSLVANIALAIALVPVGVMLYNEGFEANKIIGAALCIGGLVLINLR